MMSSRIILSNLLDVVSAERTGYWSGSLVERRVAAVVAELAVERRGSTVGAPSHLQKLKPIASQPQCLCFHPIESEPQSISTQLSETFLQWTVLPEKFGM